MFTFFVSQTQQQQKRNVSVHILPSVMETYQIQRSHDRSPFEKEAQNAPAVWSSTKRSNKQEHDDNWYSKRQSTSRNRRSVSTMRKSRTTPRKSLVSKSQSLREAEQSTFDYVKLQSFHDFAELTDPDNFRHVPKDWIVIVSDIQGSTKLIEAGRYRDVNTVGVMTITAVRNALGTINDTSIKHVEFPYVFGGDGASMVVHPEQKGVALKALLEVQLLAKENYKMHLRVGSVTVEELEDNNVSVEVAKYEIAAGMCIACFRGGGLAMADTIVKAQGGIEPSMEEMKEMAEPNLEGLSCRWKKIPSRHGCVLSLLVAKNDNYVAGQYGDGDYGDDDNDEEEEEEEDLYTIVLDKLNEILSPEDMVRANPVNTELAEYKSTSEMLEDEQRMHKNRWSLAYIKRAAEIRLCDMIFRKKKIQNAVLDAPKYVQSMRTHADHRKFDDMIRMVIDCSPGQADEIDAYLHDLHSDAGNPIFYGTHRSKHTVITCLVEDTNDGNHIHFADGDSGGYALAAKILKKQMASYAKGSPSVPIKMTKFNDEKGGSSIDIPSISVSKPRKTRSSAFDFVKGKYNNMFRGGSSSN